MFPPRPAVATTENIKKKASGYNVTFAGDKRLIPNNSLLFGVSGRAQKGPCD